jgi:hypothetical protein
MLGLISMRSVTIYAPIQLYQHRYKRFVHRPDEDATRSDLGAELLFQADAIIDLSLSAAKRLGRL